VSPEMVYESCSGGGCRSGYFFSGPDGRVGSETQAGGSLAGKDSSDASSTVSAGGVSGAGFFSSGGTGAFFCPGLATFVTTSTLNNTIRGPANADSIVIHSLKNLGRGWDRATRFRFRFKRTGVVTRAVFEGPWPRLAIFPNDTWPRATGARNSPAG
jgi:hypothetical protein